MSTDNSKINLDQLYELSDEISNQRTQVMDSLSLFLKTSNLPNLGPGDLEPLTAILEKDLTVLSVLSSGVVDFLNNLQANVAVLELPENGTTGDIERKFTDLIMNQLVPEVGFVAAREILYGALIKLEKYYVL